MAAYKMPCLLYFALLYYDMHSGLFDQEMRLWRLASFKRDWIEEFFSQTSCQECFFGSIFQLSVCK